MATFGHSPLTGIFLIRSQTWPQLAGGNAKSQSPDGDFFDPEKLQHRSLLRKATCHSPLTGIFLIRSKG